MSANGNGSADVVETVDLTPSWSGILPGLLAIVRNGETVQAQQFAEKELRHMAAMADVGVRYMRANKG